MAQAILVTHGYITEFIENLILFFKHLNDVRRKRKAVRATEKELHKLTDYELADIGLSRGEIYHVARSNENLRGWV